MFLPAGTAVPPLRETVTAAPPEQIYEPGTSPAYSNYSYALAAYVVESVTGRDAAEYLQAEALQAAGMTTASFAQPLPEHLNAELAQAYPTGHREPIPFELVGPWPPGSLTASAADMGAFMLAQLDADGSALADQPMLALMHSPALGAEQLGGLAAGPRDGARVLRGGPQRRTGHSGDLIHSHAALQRSSRRRGRHLHRAQRLRRADGLRDGPAPRCPGWLRRPLLPAHRPGAVGGGAPLRTMRRLLRAATACRGQRRAPLCGPTRCWHQCRSAPTRGR